MHPHQDVCPYDGCGRMRFDSPDALPLHCWHVHGASVFDMGVLLCPWEKCGSLRFDDEHSLMIHTNSVHMAPIVCQETGLSSGEPDRTDKPAKRHRIKFGSGYTTAEMTAPVVRRIYYDDELLLNASHEEQQQQQQQQQQQHDDDERDVYPNDDFYRDRQKRAKTNGHAHDDDDDDIENG